MQTLFLALLAFFARSIIEIKKPYVIGVTGTVGKTTISAHLAQYLMRECGNREVMHSPYHYNGEYGLPLTIIGAKTGGKNPIRWIWVFLVAVYRLMVRYPRYIVLEYGIDHPGEMDFLLSIVEPDIAIITEIMPNHIEQFKTLEAYRGEKLKLGNQAKILIAHESLRQYIEKEALYYGRGAMSEIDASHTRIDDQGTHAIVHAYQKDYPILVPVFGAFQIDNLLPLYGVAHAIGVNLDHIAHYAQTFTPESGRSGILRGINHSTIIDGSYNGGYLSIHSGISSMRSFLSSHRLVFLLGDMRELGDQTEDMHTQLGREILSIFPHEKNVYFFLVGPSMGEYVKPILASAFQTLHTLSSREAGEHIAELLKKSKDTSTMVYVKGSQNTIFLEEGIKLFLDPHEDTSKLCRQTPDWMKKKEIFFRNLNKSKAPK